MVIIRTSATEVSIQAVSPEFGVQFLVILASQAGGVSAAAAGSGRGGLGGCRRLGMNIAWPQRTARRQRGR